MTIQPARPRQAFSTSMRPLIHLLLSSEMVCSATISSACDTLGGSQADQLEEQDAYLDQRLPPGPGDSCTHRRTGIEPEVAVSSYVNICGGRCSCYKSSQAGQVLQCNALVGRDCRLNTFDGVEKSAGTI